MEFIIGQPTLIAECVLGDEAVIHQEVCFYYEVDWPAGVPRSIVHKNACRSASICVGPGRWQRRLLVGVRRGEGPFRVGAGRCRAPVGLALCASSTKRYEAFAAGTSKTPYPPTVESPTSCPSA
ncbi:hypothetical protein SALBM311S_05415 [Streptomyces alboniger]